MNVIDIHGCSPKVRHVNMIPNPQYSYETLDRSIGYKENGEF